MSIRADSPKGRVREQARLPLVYPENTEDAAWTIGYNARKAGFYRRANQFIRGTNGHAQWDYGWLAAHDEITRTKEVEND